MAATKSPYVIQGRPVYHARTWEAGGTFGIKVMLSCGACGKFTKKASLVRCKFPDLKSQAVLGQCGWCGEQNAFINGRGEYLVTG